jgi:hypothetical protein
MSLPFGYASRGNASGAVGLRQLLVMSLLALSAITNVLLIFKVRELRGVVAAIKSEGSIQVGTHVPPLTAQDLTGQSTAIRFSDTDRPTLLYVFTPSCGWCKKNEDNIKSLATQTGDRCEWLGSRFHR